VIAITNQSAFGADAAGDEWHECGASVSDIDELGAGFVGPRRSHVFRTGREVSVSAAEDLLPAQAIDHDKDDVLTVGRLRFGRAGKNRDRERERSKEALHVDFSGAKN
jgi:hypothetical protein